MDEKQELSNPLSLEKLHKMSGKPVILDDRGRLSWCLVTMLNGMISDKPEPHIVCLNEESTATIYCARFVMAEGGIFYRYPANYNPDGKRSTGMVDINGKEVFEGAHVISAFTDMHLYIRYGKYIAWCPVDQEYMPNVGFYAESDDGKQMPIGELSEWAYVIQDKSSDK